MKTLGIIFLCFVSYFAFYVYANTDISLVNQYAFCSGYTGKMYEVNNLQQYKNMQLYFDSLVGDNFDEFISEYYQSGAESAMNNNFKSNNICENLYNKGQ